MKRQSTGENMTKVLTALSLAILLHLSGCASLPSPETLRDLPVVKFGDPVPAGREYILFFPADTPISLTTSVKGNIFAKEAEQELQVTLRRGIYAYRNWISYDRVTWRVGREAIKGDVEVRIPSYQHPEPGSVRIRMDERT
jgi:hypothetical protein